VIEAVRAEPSVHDNAKEPEPTPGQMVVASIAATEIVIDPMVASGGYRRNVTDPDRAWA